MRGREREWRQVDGLLRTVGRGGGGTLLVDGEPGAGKTRLLAEAAAAASERGIDVLRGRPEELGELVPCGVLFEALDLRPEPDTGRDDPSVRLDSRARALERLRTAFEERAAAPVLAVLDDLQWADPATLMALRALHGLLAPRSVGWLLSRSTGAAKGHAASLFDLLEQNGAARVALTSLSPDAVTELTTDMLGVPPDPATLALVAAAGGNPLLVTELLAGLRDEGLLRVTGDGAHLSHAHVPNRFRRVVRHWTDSLSADARNLVETAAVLGQSFSPAQAASLLGTTPAALLPVVEECMAAGILAVNEHGLSFRQELVRGVVAAQVPQPVREALLDQIGVPGAYEPAGLPDVPSIGGIDAAVAAGRLQEAEQMVRGRLTDHEPASEVAELRCALADILYLTGRIDQAVREAETVLAVPDLPGQVRDRAIRARLYAMTSLRNGGRSVRTYARKILEQRSRHGAAATVAALMAFAATEWDKGRLADALALAEEARRLAGADEPVAHRYEPRLISAAMLTDVHRLDEARAILREARKDMFANGHLAWAADAAALEARAELLAGHLDGAVTEAERALDLATSLNTPRSAAVAGSVLAAVALRCGDLRAATRHAAHVPGDSHDGRTRHALLAARVSDMRDGPRCAMTLLADLAGRSGWQRLMLTMEPTASAWLVRMALAVNDRPAAEVVVATAEALSRANPGFPALAASAAHARGLLEGDCDALSRAAGQTQDVWARASAAEDLGVALAVAGRREDATGSLDQALAIYDDIGSVWDAARVRQRLRGMGVRHRHWGYAERPISGWDSLTETEHSVSMLVADGWTNRQIADQMFISVHTVAFHLRHIYRKLHINSRVELTRLAVAQGRIDPPAERL
ncbi:AAA family ATPase [Nonomuraea sp. NPDC000554]|uniref:helix-turn-helix transcriptional regulator n=1 Tax=Nonomuraea sp. NPDC000554 TaxID=3154259 RepID=UPI0033266B28